MRTIFAQCSGAGKAGVVVFRVSGPSALDALQQLLCHNIDTMEPRKTYLRKIYQPGSDYIIDESMIVFFKGPSSFTGEDVCEIHAHGSIAVIKMLHEVLSSLPDVRLAEAGEFAKRAFLNGKMDLTAAEGLADLIDAETSMQHKQAIRQFGGALEQIYDSWRKELLQLMSLIEAYIDFPEEDIPDSVLSDATKLVEDLAQQMQAHLRDNHKGERLRSGLKLAIIGAPNVGKSSLLNQLMQRQVAIVSDIAGTTRDVLEGHLDIGGYPIILQDTAGIREHTADVIEQEGIKRSHQSALEADIKLIMFDATSALEKNNPLFSLIDANTIILFNKIDLAPNFAVPGFFTEEMNQAPVIAIAAQNGTNIQDLIKAIIVMAEKLASPCESPQITRARHRGEIQRAITSLSDFSLYGDLILAAEDLRMTIRALSNVTGKITVDEILGQIFSNFCIGK
jgi:tRNA modification GTPase